MEGWWRGKEEGGDGRAKKRGREGSNGGVVEGEHWNKQGARKGGERKGGGRRKGRKEGKGGRWLAGITVAWVSYARYCYGSLQNIYGWWCTTYSVG